jgi:diguanylate cyclase (GGDEF)-like protein
MIFYSFLLSIILYITPIFLLFYMAVEIFIRGRTLVNRLSSALFFSLSMISMGSFLVAIIPEQYVTTSTIWLKLFPAFLLIGFALHLTIVITNRYDGWSIRRVLLISYLPTFCFLFLLIPSESIYVDAMVRGSWTYSVPSPAIFIISIIPAIYSVACCTYFLAAGLRYANRLKMTQKSRQLRSMLQAACVGGFYCIISSYFNRYLIFSDQVSYPEPSVLGIIYFAIMIRYVMKKYEFLPSIERKYKILFESSPIAILLLNERGKVIEANPAAQKLLRMPRSYFIHMTYEELFKPYRGTAMPQVNRDDLKVTVRPGSDERIVKVEKELIETGGENYEYLLLWDITDTILTEEHITFMAYSDPLTGLGNRRKFQETLADLLQVSQNRQEITAVILIDLDRFKQVNDTKGHHVGDLLLQHVADILKAQGGQAELIARLGGDEFVLLLKGICEEPVVTELCKRIMDGFMQPFIHEEATFHITASMGICITSGNVSNPELMLQHADLAMYDAKRNGRNRISFFTTNLKNDQERHHSLEARLRDALLNERLELYFQPQINLQSSKIWGVEALIRWMDVDGTVILPGEFIPLAEETGLIVPLGNWVLRQACERGKCWLDNGFPEFYISVNVSNVELSNPQWLADVEEALVTTGFPARLLHLEITESTISSKEPYIQEVYGKLLDKGIWLAIDDFGTGYSTFSAIQAIRFQLFKIDRSIINDITQNHNSREIVKAMIAMAHSLEQRVIAEGVETDEQMQILKELECDIVQGYYYSRPLPEEQFISWYQEQNLLTPE